MSDYKPVNVIEKKIANLHEVLERFYPTLSIDDIMYILKSGVYIYRSEGLTCNWAHHLAVEWEQKKKEQLKPTHPPD